MSFIIEMDQAILKFIQDRITSPFFDNFMPFVTQLGDKGILWIFIILILLFIPKHRRIGWMAMAALILGAVLGEVLLKPFIGRPRPFVDLTDFKLLIEAPMSFSFPSGHTASSFGVATVIARNIKQFKIPVLILAGAIAFSRLYLYVHYPSDVMGGLILGILSAYIIQYIFNIKKQ